LVPQVIRGCHDHRQHCLKSEEVVGCQLWEAARGQRSMAASACSAAISELHRSMPDKDVLEVAR
jgi:hypothetical protein